MATDRRDDLRAFRGFIDAQLDGGAEMTPEEALACWDLANQSDAEREETIRAIREGLEDIKAGRTYPAEEVMADLRRKYGLGGR